MAYKQIKDMDRFVNDVDGYVVDSTSDFATLPSDTPFGSRAYVISEGAEYYLDSSGEWKKAVGGGGGSSGGGSGGASLPSVTSNDNGDVLTVVEGAWGKAEPSGVSLVVNVIAGSTSELVTWTLDKTWKEIYDAFNVGVVRVNLPIGGVDDDFSVRFSTVFEMDTYGNPVDSYCVYLGYNGGSASFYELGTDSENGYPYTSFAL